MGTKGRNGLLIGAIQVQEGEEIMLISDQGTLVRTRVAEVSQLGRNTQGVTLIRLPADETLVSMMRLDAEEDNGEEGVHVDVPEPVDGEGSDAIEPTATEE